MGRGLCRVLCFALGIIFVFFVLVGTATAEEQKEPNKAVKFLRGLFHWPVSATKESADVVVDTSKQSADVIAQEGKDMGNVLTGDVQKADDIVVGPVQGTAETLSSAAEGIVNIPVEATKEAFPSDSGEPAAE